MEPHQIMTIIDEVSVIAVQTSFSNSWSEAGLTMHLRILRHIPCILKMAESRTVVDSGIGIDQLIHKHTCQNLSGPNLEPLRSERSGPCMSCHCTAPKLRKDR